MKTELLKELKSFNSIKQFKMTNTQPLKFRTNFQPTEIQFLKQFNATEIFLFDDDSYGEFRSSNYSKFEDKNNVRVLRPIAETVLLTKDQLEEIIVKAMKDWGSGKYNTRLLDVFAKQFVESLIKN